MILLCTGASLQISAGLLGEVAAAAGSSTVLLSGLRTGRWDPSEVV